MGTVAVGSCSCRGRSPRRGYREPERAAAAGLALDAHGPTVRLDDLARDEEAEPDAARARARHPVGLLEDAVEVLAGDAFARVAYLDADGAPRDGCADLDPATWRRVAHRVPEQVREHDLDALGVA